MRFINTFGRLKKKSIDGLTAIIKINKELQSDSPIVIKSVEQINALNPNKFIQYPQNKTEERLMLAVSLGKQISKCSCATVYNKTIQLIWEVGQSIRSKRVIGALLCPNLPDFIQKSSGISFQKMLQKLWGDNYFNASKKQWSNNKQAEDNKILPRKCQQSLMKFSYPLTRKYCPSIFL